MAERQPIPEALLGYNIRFDYQDYQSLKWQKPNLPREEFQRRLTQLNTRTAHNLETMLGERFNVEISRVQYRIENNQLVNLEHDEPFVKIIKRGQKFRQENGSKEVKREQAEVSGFIKIQELLTSPTLGPNAKIIIISPRGGEGSIYQHNFYDVYTKTADGTVTMSRYTSKLSYAQFHKSAQTIDPLSTLPENPTDAGFLTSPLTTYQSLDQIQKTFCPEEKVMTQNDYQMLLETCGFLLTTYINCLVNGSPMAEIQQVYNALLNFADAWPNITPLKNTEQIISHYGALPVRPVAAGCGIQSGADSQNNSPWSVSEFDKWFTCPKCNYKAIGPVGDTCPNCHLTKEEYAKESPVCA